MTKHQIQIKTLLTEITLADVEESDQERTLRLVANIAELIGPHIELSQAEAIFMEMDAEVGDIDEGMEEIINDWLSHRLDLVEQGQISSVGFSWE